MNTLKDIDIQKLSQSERILLAEKLWDSVEKEQDGFEVTSSQKEVLDQRMAAYKESKDNVISWEDVRNEMD